MADSSTAVAGACSSQGCTSVVSPEQRLACPKCIQLGILDSLFCSQECFKSNYATHKKLHVAAKKKQAAAAAAQQQQSISNDDGITCSEDAPVDEKLRMPDWAKNYKFTGNLRPARQSPRRYVPPRIRKPDYATHIAGVSDSEQREKTSNHHNIRIYGPDELDAEYGLRHACRMGREVLDIAGKALRVGVTTNEIDRVVHEACMERDCYPSPLNYYQFPKSVCTSINEVICHGIPDYREIENGDIVNLDVTVYNQGGYHGDLNETYCVGDQVDDDSRRLVETSFQCLAKAMELVKPGTLYRDLGTVIEKVAKTYGTTNWNGTGCSGSGTGNNKAKNKSTTKCSVVRTYCGHGIGSLFHTIPNVPHYAKNKARGTMKQGHVFTIEPMINLGNSYTDKTWDDNWTAVTCDGRRSAQFEHTILVTSDGYEILTARNNEPVMKWDPTLITRS